MMEDQPENYMDLVDKEKFYKQAKEFFFTQPLNSSSIEQKVDKTNGELI